MRFGELLNSIKTSHLGCFGDDMISWELFAYVLAGSSDLLESCYQHTVARKPAETILSLTN